MMLLIIFLKIDLNFLPYISFNNFFNSPINWLPAQYVKLSNQTVFFLISNYFTNRKKEGNE